MDYAFELLTEQVDPELPTITVTEHRSLERVVLGVQRLMDDLQLAPEDRVRLDVLVGTLQLQLRTPTPDRPIIARVLHGLNTFAGGLLIHAATRDDVLCGSFAQSERALNQTDISAIREALVQAIEHRYLE